MCPPKREGYMRMKASIDPTKLGPSGGGGGDRWRKRLKWSVVSLVTPLQGRPRPTHAATMIFARFSYHPLFFPLVNFLLQLLPSFVHAACVPVVAAARACAGVRSCQPWLCVHSCTHTVNAVMPLACVHLAGACASAFMRAPCGRVRVWCPSGHRSCLCLDT